MPVQARVHRTFQKEKAFPLSELGCVNRDVPLRCHRISCVARQHPSRKYIACAPARHTRYCYHYEQFPLSGRIKQPRKATFQRCQIKFSSSRTGKCDSALLSVSHYLGTQVRGHRGRPCNIRPALDLVSYGAQLMPPTFRNGFNGKLSSAGLQHKRGAVRNCAVPLKYLTVPR